MTPGSNATTASSVGLLSPSRQRWLYNAYVVLCTLLMLWVVANCLYVYLVLKGDRSYRVESAVFGLVLALLPLVLMGGKPAAAIEWTRRQRIAVCATVIGIWLIIFLPLLGFPFLSDDFVFLDRYTDVNSAPHSPFFFRPLFAVTFWFLSRLGGGSPVPFHVVSLALHLSAQRR